MCIRDSDYVVDHIDTNRRNNRAENLRWVTRLDNILLNPITCARIVQAFGSLEAFFENPKMCIRDSCRLLAPEI